MTVTQSACSPRFREQHAAAEVHPQPVIVAAEQQVHRALLQQGPILGGVGVRQRDDQVGAGFAQRRALFGRHLRDRPEGDRAGTGLDRGTERGETEDADLVGAGRRQHRGARAVDDLAVGVDVVGAQNRELRFGETLLGDLGAEVVLVIADCHCGQVEAIEQFDHVRALIEAGQQGGRDGVAGKGNQDVAPGGPFGGDYRGQAGYPSLAAALVHSVQVVEVDDGQFHRLRNAGAGDQEQGRERRGRARSANPLGGGVHGVSSAAHAVECCAGLADSSASQTA